MKLIWIDWVIIVVTLVICFFPALLFGRRAGKNTTEFFASGRSVPWWLAGLSMVATTFSSDTPNLVTDIVRRQGVAGNWCWWAFTLTGVATVFFYARLWRRSGVMTDLEFYELRYSGKSASAVRGFRAIYLGLFFNCLIMASVNLAACKIAAILFGIPMWETLVFVGALNVVFAMHSGLWGVLVIDMIQFFIKMTAVIAAAYFGVRYISPNHDSAAEGMRIILQKLGESQWDPDHKHKIHFLNLFPDFSNNWDLALAVFIMPIAVQWWAVWYPGAEPGGGSYIAQRMLASKSEKDSLGAVLFFNLAHYVLRPWPWIITGLASMIIYPELADIQKAFPNLPAGIPMGHDLGFPAMLKFMPAGFVGLMVGGLIAANSSTILTHLNWGSSYIVHDFYRRFVHRNGSEHHYVWAGRISTVVLFCVQFIMVFFLTSAKDSFDIIVQVGAGTGLLYLIRWFWWRINAWCEVVAMISSFVISVAFLIYNRHAPAPISTHIALILTILFTTVCWVTAAFLAPQTDRKVLTNFYKKVRPFGPGWEPIRKEAGITKAELAATKENIPLALIGWSAGCATIWSSLFTIGNLLYGRWDYFWMCFAIFVVSGLILVKVVSTLWTAKSEEEVEHEAAAARKS